MVEMTETANTSTTQPTEVWSSWMKLAGVQHFDGLSIACHRVLSNDVKALTFCHPLLESRTARGKPSYANVHQMRQ